MRRFEVVQGRSAKFWEIAVEGAFVELRWGRIGAKGQSKTKSFESPKDAANEAEQLVVKKVREGYREVTEAADAGAETANPEVLAILAELRELGATVDTGEGETSEDDVRRAEAELGFALPTEYREFLVQFGHVKIGLERTWNFYGLAEAFAVTETYRKEFGETSPGGPYYPERFIVLHDEGAYANAGSGTVYDADLDAFLVTDGLRWVDRQEAFAVGYWGYLLDELGEIRDRIADSDDILVAGGARDIARRQNKRDEGASGPTMAGASSRLRDARERVYAAFEHHLLQVRDRFCFAGKRCKECKHSNKALNGTPLRDVRHQDLFHFAYFGKVETAEQKSDYKHFVPRIVELLDDLSLHGNPSVVVGQILRKIGEATPTQDEDDAVETALRRQWEWLLQNPATKTGTFAAYLQWFACWRKDVGPFLAAWTALFEQDVALVHAAAFVTSHLFDVDAKGHGWPEAPFGELRKWLFSKALKQAFERKKTFGAALEALEHARP